MTIWDGMALTILIGVTGYFFYKAFLASPKPDNQVDIAEEIAKARLAQQKEPSLPAKIILSLLFFAMCGGLIWAGLEDPMGVTRSQKVGFSGPRGPVIEFHNYMLAVLGFSLLLWVLIGLLKTKLRPEKSQD